ncbi:hypothetical protein GGF32_003530 [Allomyces javanicus]|nr:hypothetical protein GGF32_003530 [Allomyces javanicus]
MSNLLARHFGDTTSRRTEADLERERFLIGSIPFQRWVLFPAGAIVQLAVGSLYAWSVYNAPIATLLESTAETISYTFYIAIAGFGLAAFLGGPWLERHGPKKMVAIGSVMFFLAHMLAGVACHIKRFALLYVGYGVLGGLGIGFVYICPVSVLTKWFPEIRGFASSVGVAAFGAGAVIASFTQDALITSHGPRNTFFILGAVYFVLSFGSAMLLRYPPPVAPVMTRVDSPHDDLDKNETEMTPAVEKGNEPSPLGTTLAEDLLSRNFAFVYVIFFLAVIPGLVTISRVSDMVKTAFGKPKSTGTWVTGVNGIFNVLGRMVFGALSDKFGRMPMMLVSITLTIISLVVVLISINNQQFELFLVFFFALTSAFGAALGLIPGLLSDCFSAARIGALFGTAMTAWAAGGVAGGVAFTAVIKSQREAGVKPWHVYDIAFYSMIPLAALGLILAAIFWKVRRSAVAHK